MDRYLCRAKRKGIKEWIQGYYFKEEVFSYSGVIEVHYLINSINHIYERTIEFIEVDPDTVCHWIGYCDNYHTPIFENDIVAFGDKDSYRHKELVWYCKEMQMLTSVPLDGISFNGTDYWNGKYPNVEFSTLCLMLQDPWGDFSEIKILGNIIDNPELIEEYK